MAPHRKRVLPCTAVKHAPPLAVKAASTAAAARDLPPPPSTADAKRPAEAAPVRASTPRTLKIPNTLSHTKWITRTNAYLRRVCELGIQHLSEMEKFKTICAHEPRDVLCSPQRHHNVHALRTIWRWRVTELPDGVFLRLTDAMNPPARNMMAELNAIVRQFEPNATAPRPEWTAPTALAHADMRHLVTTEHVCHAILQWHHHRATTFAHVSIEVEEHMFHPLVACAIRLDHPWLIYQARSSYNQPFTRQHLVEIMERDSVACLRVVHLFRYRHTTLLTEEAALICARHGSARCLRFLLTHIDTDISGVNLSRAAVENDHTDILQLLLVQRRRCMPQLAEFAAALGRWRCLKELLRHRHRINYRTTMRAAVQSGSQPTVQFLLACLNRQGMAPYKEDLSPESWATHSRLWHDVLFIAVPMLLPDFMNAEEELELLQRVLV